MSTSAAPTASSYNQAYRARTPVNSPFLAAAGSTVSAVVGFRVMLEFYNETSGYTQTGWIEQTDYVIPDDSTVWAQIAAKTESGSEIPLQTLVNGVVLNIKSRIDGAIEATQYGDIAGFNSVQFISRQGEFSGVTGNKVAAIKAARKNGYDSIRLSICKTADDYVVLSHDSTVTIGGVEYVIADSNYADISSVVDLFSDAVLLCKRLGMTLVAEIKYGFSPVSEISTAMDIVAVNGMGKSVIWSSWKSMLEAIQTINPDASLALVGHLSETVINDAASLKNGRNFVRIDAYNVNHNPEWEDDYSDSNLILAANKGLPIKVGSVYTKSDLLYWVGKVEIIEVANLINPKKILLQEYLT